MVTLFRSLCFLLLGCWALSACEKSTDPTAPIPSTHNPLVAFQMRNGVTPEFFTYNPRRIPRYVSKRGSAIELGAEAFVTLGGLQLSDAPVRLEFREVLDKKDMLLSGIPSGTDDLILESGGQFYLQATQDNRPLELVPRVRIGLASRSPARLSRLTDMRMYTVKGPLLPDPFTWQPSTDQESTVRLGLRLTPDSPDYLLAVLNHQLFNQSMGWVSYQRQLYTGTTTTTIQVTVEAAAEEPQQTLAYLVFADYNAVAQFRATGPNTFSLANVPTGTEATVVVLRGAGGKFYLGQQTALMQVDQRFTPTLTEMSETSVVAELSKF
ncbi:hypothetical protein H8B13_11910 [Hymenobacter sp. BT188]|uniref:hypothetical protein n=1 Tax=Hymenobacter sp. BT188 TaxID=2763504 RepID=UPI0016510EAB|nr:hypothetical protein [Hymenobacter sp. BT188]MBC6607525.1 hypothetical protein [Hymenobacter sp. BT188]